MGVGVEVAQGQSLHFGEQVPADGVGGLLGDTDHDAGVGVAEQRRADINAGHEHQSPGQPGVIPGNDAVVDQGTEHIGAADGADRIQHQAYRHQKQQPLRPSDIAHEGADGLAGILGLLEAPSGAAVASGPVGPSSFCLSHRCSPPPAGTGRRPCKFHWFPSIPRGSRRLPPGRHP